MDEVQEKAWTYLMQRIGSDIQDPILRLAFVHPTYALEQGQKHKDNQRLEFLGDAVLGLVVGEMLYREYPAKNEGTLSSIRGVAVSETTLAQLALDLHFPDLLMLGKGEEKSGGRYRMSILADAFEAFLGGLYLCCDFRILSDFVISLMRPVLQQIIETGYKDPKTTLQEMVQEKYKRNVTYRLLEERGPDHDKNFTCGVLWDDEIIALGRGKNKKDAERQAAVLAIDYFASVH